MAGALKKSDIEILLSTMNRTSLDFLVPMFPFAHFSDFNILIVNQTTEDKPLVSPYTNIRIVNSFELGLSRSRNLAMQNSIAHICLFTDDDVVFIPGFQKGILKAFNDNPEAALIAFRAENGAGKPYRKYAPGRTTNTTVIDRLLILSIEMAVNRRYIAKMGISFDEQFGLGAAYGMGEEAIFAHDLYTAGGQIVLEPHTIVSHASQDTHSRAIVADKYFIQGAFFSRLFGNQWLLWVFTKLAYELKNKKICFANVAVAIRAAYKGRNAFKRK